MVVAATHILNHPQDVAFHSMRDLAKRAHVPPVTFVRLSQRLGLSGFAELKRTFVQSLLTGDAGRRSMATRNIESAQKILADSDGSGSTHQLSASFFAAEHYLLERAANSCTDAELDAAAGLIAKAKRVLVIGRRTSFPPAFTLAFALRKARPGVVLIDDFAGAPDGSIEDAEAGDAIIAFTYAPFSRTTDTLVRRAVSRKVTAIVISDSWAAPIRELAGDLFFLTPSLSRSFLELAIGATAIANLLAVFAIRRLGKAAETRIRDNEQFLVGTSEYMLPGKRSRRRKRPD